MSKAKAAIKGGLVWTGRIGGAVGAARLGSKVSTPLLARLSNAVGLTKYVPLGLRAFAVDASIALHAVGGFCLGNYAGEKAGKLIG